MGDEDTEDLTFRYIIENWPYLMGFQNAASTGDVVTKMGNTAYGQSVIKSMFLDVARDMRTGEISSKRLGHYFKRWQGVVKEGKVLKSRVLHKQLIWWVESI
jgi:hypothetical protein